MKTILVTGGTGYIGSWVIEMLLTRGYRVLAAVRGEISSKRYAFLSEMAGERKGEIQLFTADLLEPGSFDSAARESDAIIHLASPFTLRVRDPKHELIDPALRGTRNVLSAANASPRVKRVVLTSSVAAVHGDNIDMRELAVNRFTEEHFNYSSNLKHQPYSYSKVIAEQEAWKIFKEQDSWTMAVINPAFVIGPSLSKGSNSESLHFIKSLLGGTYRMGVPDLMLGFVDVRDVALAHVSALENCRIEGRYILSSEVITVLELALRVSRLFPNRFKLPSHTIPKFILYLVGGIFGLSPGFIRRNVGYPLAYSVERSIRDLGMKYRTVEQSIKDMVAQMETNR